MATGADREISNMEGAAALPRDNGELIFEAPWEGRAFGIAVALNDQRVYEWREFRDELVEKIAADEAAAGQSPYYGRWLAAMEQVLLKRGLVTAEELDVRTAEYASGERDDDWDHDH